VSRTTPSETFSVLVYTKCMYTPNRIVVKILREKIEVGALLISGKPGRNGCFCRR
jgi:hypothetical protein